MSNGYLYRFQCIKHPYDDADVRRQEQPNSFEGFELKYDTENELRRMIYDGVERGTTT
jgi:hypothetical protein